MGWPQTVDYNAAIQNPADCFRDPDLMRGEAAEGMIPGIPLSFAGSFATVYKVQRAGSPPWAVKCFTRQVSNLHTRYKQISDHLQQKKRRFAVDFQYLQEGIQVGGLWYPVVKMQWVEGFTLNEFLRERVANPSLLEQLCQLWLRLGAELREDKTAHGDLQHGNVMLVPGASASSLLLRLVDYDGMWVPALADTPPGEVGHPNYQHPQRLTRGGYSVEIDRFSHLLVYTALRCLMVGGKSLWAAHDNEENLLFRESDFKAPGQSKLLPKLLSLSEPGAVALTGHLLLASQGPLDAVPLLADLLAGAAVCPLTSEQFDRLYDLVPPAQLPRPAIPPPPPLPVPTAEASDPGGQAKAVGSGRRSSLRPPSTPAIELLPEVVPVEPVMALAADTPTAVPLAPTTATVLEALPAEPLPRRAAPVPLNKSAIPVPPPPVPKRREQDTPISVAPITRLPPPPEWFLRLGFAEDSPVARFWPVTLAAVAAVPLLLLFGLTVWVVWPSSRSPVPPQAGVRARLLPTGEVLLRAGHAREVVLVVDRQSTAEALTVHAEGLPEGVDCPQAVLPAGSGPAQVRLRLNSRPEAAAFSGRMVVRLLHGDEMLDEQQVALNVKAFVAPRLIKKSLQSIQLLTGTTRFVQVEVDANGNTDPWSLRLDPLPSGVSQRRQWRAGRQAAIELVVAANAPPRESLITVVSLFADGVFADSMNVSLSVENGSGKGEVALGLDLPTGIRLRPGGTARIKIDVKRNGYAGPVRLEAESLPVGITAESVVVPEGNDSAEIELSAGKATMLLRLQLYRVVARVADKIVGRCEGTFLFERDGVVKPPDQPKPDPTMPRPQAVTFQAADGVQLRGTFYSSAKGRKGACVLMISEPGKDFSRKDPAWILLAQQLQKLDCAVLTFDFRGFGESDKDSLPFTFWHFTANKVLQNHLKRLGVVRFGNPTTLDGKQFPPAYLPWLVQDIVAARHFLDSQHDTGEVNSHNLIVIAAGEGTTLATLWLAAEYRRFKSPLLPPALVAKVPAEGRDVIGAVWLDGSFTLGRTSVTGSLATAARQFRQEKTLPPMRFVYDPKAAGARQRNRYLMTTLQQKPTAEKPIDGSSAAGQAVLNDQDAEKAVLEFVSDLVQKHEMRPWDNRGVQRNGYIWTLGGKSHLAKGAFANVPMPLPLDQVGFKLLPAR
jgi:hypothetical protein